MARVNVYRRTDDLYDWLLIGDNGETMCGSAQGYTEQNDAWEGFYRCRSAMAELLGYEEVADDDVEGDENGAEETS